MTRSTPRNVPYFVYWLHDDRCVCPFRHGYIGITYRPTRRLLDHRKSRAGQPDFKMTVLFVGSKFECQVIEYKLRPCINIGWNKRTGGERGVYPHTREARKKMSIRAKQPDYLERLRKGRETIQRLAGTGVLSFPKSEEHRRRIAASLTGKIRTANSRAKQSASTKGKQKTVEWRERMSNLIFAKARIVPRTPSQERARLAKNTKRAERRALGLPRLY